MRSTRPALRRSQLRFRRRPLPPSSSRFRPSARSSFAAAAIVTIVPRPAQRVTILEGSSQFTRFRVDREGKLQIDACNEQCPRNYHLRVQIESPRIMPASA